MAQSTFPTNCYKYPRVSRTNLMAWQNPLLPPCDRNHPHACHESSKAWAWLNLLHQPCTIADATILTFFLNFLHESHSVHIQMKQMKRMKQMKHTKTMHKDSLRDTADMSTWLSQHSSSFDRCNTHFNTHATNVTQSTQRFISSQQHALQHTCNKHDSINSAIHLITATHTYPRRLANQEHNERWGAGVEYHFQEFNEPYAPS